MIIKIGSASVMSIVEASSEVGAPKTEWNFEKRPGMLYVVALAVRVGTNNNGDHFSYDELKKAWNTFIGKGVFVNHQSSDIEAKRGIIVDAQFIENGAPDKAYVKCLMEIDEKARPDFAQMIRSGHINSVSMGASVAYATCSICNNIAKTLKDCCVHVRMAKGRFYNGKHVYEVNHQVEFIELSWVTVPAEPTAKVLQILAKQARLENTDVISLYAKASKDPMYISNLQGNQKSLEDIIVASMKAANDRKAS